MKKYTLTLLALLSLINLTFSQSEFQKYVDSGAQKLPYDDYAQSVLINNLENKMLHDLGWSDKVVWTKGIVKNIMVGAIDGKCGTKKGEVFYFRTVIKEVDGEVLWDEESFSKNVQENYLKLKASRENCVVVYTKKLQEFDDSLYNIYSGKYDSIYNKQRADYDSLISRFGTFGKRYMRDNSDMDFKFDKMKENKEYAKNEISEIILPVSMYEPDFRNAINCADYYSQLIDKAQEEATEIDNRAMNIFFESSDYLAFLNKTENDLQNLKRTHDSINHIRYLEKKVFSDRDNIEKRIMDLLAKINNRDYKKRFKELKSNANASQLDFLKEYLTKVPYYKVLSEYQAYGYIRHFRIDAFDNKPNNQAKIDRMKFWSDNLEYWEKGLE